MLQRLFVVFFLTIATVCFAQQPNNPEKEKTQHAKDSLKKSEFLKNIGNGFFSIQLF